MEEEIIDARTAVEERAEPEEQRGLGMILEGAMMEFNDSVNMETDDA